MWVRMPGHHFTEAEQPQACPACVKHLCGLHKKRQCTFRPDLRSLHMFSLHFRLAGQLQACRALAQHLCTLQTARRHVVLDQLQDCQDIHRASLWGLVAAPHAIGWVSISCSPQHAGWVLLICLSRG